MTDEEFQAELDQMKADADRIFEHAVPEKMLPLDTDHG